MKSGDIYEVADVVRNLSFKQKEKGTLSTGEKKMLNNAKVILVSELVLAGQASKDEIEQLVDNKIEMSYKEFRIPTEAKIDLKQNAISKFIPFDGNK
jgi:RNA polymerase-interacting CarD/CdnL/TRCF family regulator